MQKIFETFAKTDVYNHMNQEMENPTAADANGSSLPPVYLGPLVDVQTSQRAYASLAANAPNHLHGALLAGSAWGTNIDREVQKM